LEVNNQTPNPLTVGLPGHLTDVMRKWNIYSAAVNGVRLPDRRIGFNTSVTVICNLWIYEVET
jgi:hypothetical protein